MNFYQHGSIASHACAGIAIAEMSARLSVCLSVRLSVTLWYCIKTNNSVIHGFFTDGQREDSSFCKYPVHPEIWKGQLRARSIYETGVGTNWLAAKCSGTLLSDDISFMGLFKRVPWKRERQTGQVFSLLSHMLFGVHWCLEFICRLI